MGISGRLVRFSFVNTLSYCSRSASAFDVLSVQARLFQNNVWMPADSERRSFRYDHALLTPVLLALSLAIRSGCVTSSTSVFSMGFTNAFCGAISYAPVYYLVFRLSNSFGPLVCTVTPVHHPFNFWANPGKVVFCLCHLGWNKLLGCGLERCEPSSRQPTGFQGTNRDIHQQRKPCGYEDHHSFPLLNWKTFLGGLLAGFGITSTSNKIAL